MPLQDPVKKLLTTPVNVLKNKYFSSYLWLNFYYNTACLLLNTLYFLRNFELDIFVKYGAGFSYHLIVLVCTIWILLVVRLNKKHEIYQKFQTFLWPLQNSKYKKNMAKEANRLVLFRNMFLFYIIPFTLLIPFLLYGKVQTLCLPYKILAEGKPPIVIAIFSICHLLMIDLSYFILIFQQFFPAYLYLILKYQLIQLRLYMNQLQKRNYGCQKIEYLVDNKVYQEEVWAILKFAIKRHVEIKRVTFIISKYISQFGTTFLSTGYLMAVGCLWLLITQKDFVLSSLILSGFLAFVAYSSFCGQSIEDEHANLYYFLLQLPWYNWNIKNRKAYLLILQNCSFSLKIRVVQSLNLNRQFLVKVIRSLYSMGNIARRINNNSRIDI